MTDLTYEDGPELVPPAELLELRSQLSVAPHPEIRRSHLEAIVAQVRNRPRTAWGRVVSGAARGATALAVTLTVTTGLAAAQVLPAPAQKILSSVSDRFTGGVDSPDAPEEPDVAEPAPASDDDTTTAAAETTDRSTAEPATTTTTSTTVVAVAPDVTAAVEPTTTTTTTTAPIPTTTAPTTVPSPTGTEEGPPPTTEPVEEPVEEEPVEEEPVDPNEPTEPAQPPGATTSAVDDGGTAQEGDPG